MPTLPRPFIRRSADLRPVATPAADRAPLPRQRPVQSGNGRPTAAPVANRAGGVASRPVRASSRTFLDRLFPVKPGMAEPSWSRVIGLVIFMALIWELFSFAYTYFFGINVFGVRMPANDMTVAGKAMIQ